MEQKKSKKKPNGYWTEEHCYEEAQKYTTRSDFYKYSGSAYAAALKNKWIDNYVWLESSQKSKNQFNHDRCIEEAQKYSSMEEFQSKSKTAFETAQNNGWLDECVSNFMALTAPGLPKEYSISAKSFTSDNTDEKQMRFSNSVNKVVNFGAEQPEGNFCVYSYQFEDQKVAFIGHNLSMGTNHRDAYHRTSEDSPVYMFAQENGVAVPSMQFICQLVSLATASQAEGDTAKELRESGYEVRNAMDGTDFKTEEELSPSGRLQTIAQKFIDSPKKISHVGCFLVARLCSSKSELQEKYPEIYEYACSTGWIDNYTWLKD